MGSRARNAIESAIGLLLAAELAKDGYEYVTEEDENFFRKKQGATTWNLSFHLSGDHDYYVMDHVWMNYDDLEDVLQDLLNTSDMGRDDRRLQLSVSGHATSYWPESLAKQIRDLDDVGRFSEAFLSAFRRAEKEFFEFYLDPAKTAQQCTLFYTKWPSGMLANRTAFFLIAYGLQRADAEKVQMGIQRISAKIHMCQTECERNLALAVQAAAAKASATPPTTSSR
jgi:hypothetical protein